MRQFVLAVFAAALIAAMTAAASAQVAEPPVEPPAVQERPTPEAEPADNAVMDEGYVRAMLEALGMEDIRNFERDGVYYRTVATWFGEEAELRIDARTGAVIEPEHLSENQIVRSLRQIQRFDEVLAVERDGDFYQVVAERGGLRYDLTVDARSGDVVELRAR